VINTEDDVDSFVAWYSGISEVITSSRTDHNNASSLFFGSWSYNGAKGNLNETYGPEAYNLTTLYAKSIAEFVEHAEWTRIALITHPSDFYRLTAEHLVYYLDSSFNPYVFQFPEQSVDQILQTIQYLKFRIVIVILPQHDLSKILCHKLRLKMEWPNYAWLVIGNYDKIHSMPACLEMVIVFSQGKMYAITSNIKCNKLVMVSKYSTPHPRKSCDLYFTEYDVIETYLWTTVPEYISNYSFFSRFQVLFSGQTTQ